MLRIPVKFWQNGRKVSEQLVEKSEILELKQQARLDCYSHLNWDSLDEEFTHVIYYKGYQGYRKELQAVDIYLGEGEAVTDEMLNEITHKSFIQEIGAFHRPPATPIKEAQEETVENLASELSAKIINTFDDPILQCTIEASKDSSTAFAKFLKALDSKFTKSDVVEKAIQLLKDDPSLKEACVYIKANSPLFFVIKDVIHKKYLNTEENTTELEKAEAFDTQEDAEEFLSDLKRSENILDYISKEDLEKVKAEEKEFWGEDYEEELRFADNKDLGIIDLMSAWDSVEFEIIPIYAKEFTESKKIKESKEKNIKVDFSIPISDSGRIKVNDAKKLLKKLASLQILKAGVTYFITDAAGNETCWDFQKSIDPFYTYEFSCEVTDDERDFYNCLYLSKKAGKLDLKNSEWEAHKVESKKVSQPILREVKFILNSSDEDSNKEQEEKIEEKNSRVEQLVSSFLDDCLAELSEEQKRVRLVVLQEKEESIPELVSNFLDDCLKDLMEK